MVAPPAKAIWLGIDYAEFERWVADQDAWRGVVYQQRTRAPALLGTLETFGGYGVGNPRDFVSDKMHSLVNR